MTHDSPKWKVFALELRDAVEAKADIGKRRSLTVSPRMEEVLRKIQEAENGLRT